jgi:hypothetical protein
MTTTIVQLSGDTPLTFLEQCQRVRQEVGANGTGPSTVISQSGEYKRIVDWVADADTEVQRRSNEWKFMRGDFEITTVVDDGSYLPSETDIPITNFRDWRPTTFKIYLKSAGAGTEAELPYIDYQCYLDLKVGDATSSQPTYFTIGNSMEILLWPVPDSVYTVTGEYQKSAAKMTADDDSPPYPAEFHMLPVYRAMMRYARYNSAAEIYQDAERDYNRMLREMERTQLPRMQYGAPLA